MKNFFFICFIAVSALALSTSVSTPNYQFAQVNSGNDTTPPMMSDSMHHGAMKMHNKRGKMMKDSTSGMSMKSDSTSTVPPKK